MAAYSHSATAMAASAPTPSSRSEPIPDGISSRKEENDAPAAAKPLRHDHKCAIAGSCEHGPCKYSHYICRREEHFEKYRCEDGRGHPTNLNKPCKGVAKIECGLCRGLVCKACYNVHSAHSSRRWNQNDTRSDRRRV
ncbi:hypothetical protein KCU73_g11218, partial [Aureobasidium melanogenum]